MYYHQVLDSLQLVYGDLYHAKNVLLSATHTHSGPGGYLQYLLFNIATMGFTKETFDAIVQGVTKVITF